MLDTATIETIHKISYSSPEVHKRMLQAFIDLKITSEDSVQKQMKIIAFDIALEKWKEDGQPELWTFSIEDHVFAFAKNANGDCSLLVVDPTKIKAMNEMMESKIPNPFENLFKIEDRPIVSEWKK
jgi:hypothetical protein